MLSIKKDPSITSLSTDQSVMNHCVEGDTKSIRHPGDDYEEKEKKMCSVYSLKLYFSLSKQSVTYKMGIKPSIVKIRSFCLSK